MSNQVKPIPDGYHTITPHMVLSDAARAIEFYATAFGAKEIMRVPGPDGKKIMHAEVQIGDSRVMICDEFPEMGCVSPEKIGGSSVSMFVYVEDVDAAHKKALEAGCKEKMPCTNTFWGDRHSQVADPFGYSWSLSMHVEDLPAAEMKKRQEEHFKQMAKV